MNSERKNYPMKEFREIFPISSILVISSEYAKKDNFSILAVIQNIWVVDLNSERKNYPMKEFRSIFSFSSILVIRSGYAKKDNFSILAVIQNIWDLHILGCRFEFRTQKLPYERISGNFFDFIDFGHQVRVCKKRSFLNISCNSKCKGFSYIWVADLNSQRKNYPMKEFWAIFPISSILVNRSGYAKKDHFWILTVI